VDQKLLCWPGSASRPLAGFVGGGPEHKEWTQTAGREGTGQRKMEGKAEQGEERGGEGIGTSSILALFCSVSNAQWRGDSGGQKVWV